VNYRLHEANRSEEDSHPYLNRKHDPNRISQGPTVKTGIQIKETNGAPDGGNEVSKSAAALQEAEAQAGEGTGLGDYSTQELYREL
jgi:hypothetical protein